MRLLAFLTQNLKGIIYLVAIFPQVVVPTFLFLDLTKVIV